MSFLPSLLILFVHEPARPLALNRAHMRDMFSDIAAVLRKRQTWLGFLFLLSPIAYCAAYSLFSGIGVDFHASPRAVQWVTGIPGGVISVMLGSWVGGMMCDRWPKRVAFISTGVLAALVAAVMAAASDPAQARVGHAAIHGDGLAAFLAHVPDGGIDLAGCGKRRINARPLRALGFVVAVAEGMATPVEAVSLDDLVLGYMSQGKRGGGPATAPEIPR